MQLTLISMAIQNNIFYSIVDLKLEQAVSMYKYFWSNLFLISSS